MPLPSRPPGQHVGEQSALLGRTAQRGQHVHEEEVRLRDLGDRRVFGGNRPDHLRQHHGGEVRPAVRGRDGDREQAAGVQGGEVSPGTDPARSRSITPLVSDAA